MVKPTPEDAKGFDIVVWVDNDGDVIATPYTKGGEEWIQSIFPVWVPGEKVVILSEPQEFFNAIPNDVTVGMLKWNGIAMATKNTLH